MSSLGLSPRDALGLAREAQRGPGAARPLLLIGPRAAELASALAAGGEPHLVRTSGDAAAATALVVICDGAPRSVDQDAMRQATRAGVPIVAVDLGEEGGARSPYILATSRVHADRGGPFPVERIVQALARAVGRDGVALAAGLPGLRDGTRRRRIVEAALCCGTLAALRKGGGPQSSAITLVQARMLRQLDAAGGVGHELDVAAASRLVGPELAASASLSIAGRRIARSVPIQGRAVDAVVASAATLALGFAAMRLR